MAVWMAAQWWTAARWQLGLFPVTSPHPHPPPPVYDPANKLSEMGGSWILTCCCCLSFLFFLNFKASQRYDAKRSDSDENTLWAKFLVISPHFLFLCITNVITILCIFFFYFFFFFSMWVRLRLWLKVLTFSLAIIWFNSKRQHERRSTAPWATINSQRRPTLPRTLLFLLTLIEV